jgi:hypothetical protein
VLRFLCGTDGILKYYLDELRFQREGTVLIVMCLSDTCRYILQWSTFSIFRFGSNYARHYVFRGGMMWGFTAQTKSLRLTSTLWLTTASFSTVITHYLSARHLERPSWQENILSGLVRISDVNRSSGRKVTQLKSTIIQEKQLNYFFNSSIQNWSIRNCKYLRR